MTPQEKSARQMARIRSDPDRYAQYLAKARERQASRRASGVDAAWRSQPEVRERIRLHKERYRRAAGIPSRADKASMTEQRRRSEERKRIDRMSFIENFIGPPPPTRSEIGARAYYMWRMTNDADFYAKELDRAQRYKSNTRPGYRDSIVKWADMPAAVKQAKHAIYLIAKELKESQDENDQ